MLFFCSHYTFLNYFFPATCRKRKTSYRQEQPFSHQYQSICGRAAFWSQITYFCRIPQHAEDTQKILISVLWFPSVVTAPSTHSFALFQHRSSIKTTQGGKETKAGCWLNPCAFPRVFKGRLVPRLTIAQAIVVQPRALLPHHTSRSWVCQSCSSRIVEDRGSREAGTILLSACFLWVLMTLLFSLTPHSAHHISYQIKKFSRLCTT